MTKQSRLRIALALNALIVVFQVAYGITSGSLGLLADAGHNLTDVAAVTLSLFAIWLSQRAPTQKRSFGYHRSTILAAQANAAGIIGVTVLILFEGTRRLLNPQPVEGGTVVIVAGFALLANTAAALMLRHHGHDLNLRSALLHLAGDAATSLAVVIAGAVIALTGGNYWVDPAISLVAGAWIGWHALRLLRATTDVLMESTPAGLDPAEIADSIRAAEGVQGVHDLHVWELTSGLNALSAHVVLVGMPTLEQAQSRCAHIKEMLGHKYRIAHATLELESETCSDGISERCAMESVSAQGAIRGPHIH